MKKLAIVCLFTLAISGLQAAVTAKSKSEFCSNQKDASYMKRLIQDRDNRMGFRNHGGLANGGVCWWHSRMLRNSLYLTVYSPLKDRPTSKEAKKILSKLKSGKYVVEIPGFDNFSDFSYYYRHEVQSALESWQVADGFFRQKWMDGLVGASEISASYFKVKMDGLYNYVVGTDSIAYQMLQIPGIDAHAWLVYDMKKTYNGYKLYVIDSNYSSPQVYHYEEGDTHFNYGGYGPFVPYTQGVDELRKLRKTIDKFCSGKKKLFTVN